VNVDWLKFAPLVPRRVAHTLSLLYRDVPQTDAQTASLGLCLVLFCTLVQEPLFTAGELLNLVSLELVSGHLGDDSRLADVSPTPLGQPRKMGLSLHDSSALLLAEDGRGAG